MILSDNQEVVLLSWLMISSLFLQMGGLFFAVSVDRYVPKEKRRTMQVILLLVLTLIIQNMVDETLGVTDSSRWIRTLVSVFGYCVRPVIVILFGEIIEPRRSRLLGWCLIAVNTLTYLTAFFSDIAFTFRTGGFSRGPLGYTCHIVSFFLCVWNTYRAVRRFHRNNTVESAVPVAVSLLVIISAMMDVVFQIDAPVSCLSITMTTGCVFYYIWLHLQFVRDHEEAMLSEQRIQIMLTQIQPHFLFNTLSAIQALCRIDPERAFDTLEKFGSYLRENLDSLNKPALIPFRDEVKHTATYAEIEKVRFPNIRVEYRLREEDFLVPALTLQPLVENEMRHGVRAKEDGWILVESYREDGYFVYSVRDNGIGFDPDSIPEEERTHIGLDNVRERIMRQCGGTVQVESERGNGTVITVRIPEKGS